jgi:hypothetical protein
MRTEFKIIVLVAVLLLPVVFAPASYAALSAVGPTDPTNGFPEWYQDATGLSLAPCFDSNGFCAVTMSGVPNPTAPVVFPTNFPEEFFYFEANTSAGTTLYYAALKGAFFNGPVSDGDQMVFARIRIRDTAAPDGMYTVTHPYGVDTIVAAGGGVNFTEDIGTIPGIFTMALTGRVGPFLRNATGLITSPDGNTYIGDSTTPVLVTGTSVTSVTVAGPLNATSNTFVIEGKVFVSTPEPPAGGVIAGAVKSDSNVAIGGVRVQVFSSAGMPMPTMPMFIGETTTDGSGNYSFGGLQKGTYLVCFDGSAANYINECYENKPWNSWSDIAYATAVNVTYGQTTTLNDALLTPGGSITGTVTNNSGAGIGNVSVSVYDSLNMWVRGTSTGPDGNYTVAGLPTGSYKVCFDAFMTDYLSECYLDKAGMDLLNATPVSVTAGQTADHIDAELTQGGIITGLVKNESNAGIGNVWVTVYDTGGMPMPMPMPMPIHSASTDTNGTYTIGGFATGTYKVCFDGSSNGYIKECYDNKSWSAESDIVNADPVQVSAGQTKILNDAMLASGGTISGQVTSDGATGISSVWVYVCRYDSMTRICSYAGGMPTDLNGNYTVGGLASGNYKVWFDTSMLIWSGSDYLSQWYDNKMDEASANIVQVTAPASTAISAQLVQGGRISGTVTNGAVGIPGIRVGLYDSNGMPLYVPPMGMGAVTNPDGTYSMGGLRTGGYKVCFDAYGTGYISECYDNKAFDPIGADTVAVTVSQTTSNINAVLVQGATITGRVTDGTSGLFNVYVELYDAATGMWRSSVMTDWNGNYTIGGLAAGFYKVHFSSMMSDYLSEWYNDKADMDTADVVLITAGEPRTLIDAVLSLAGSYTVSTSAGPGGSISPAQQSVMGGDIAYFTVSPDSGYEVSSVSGCGGTWSGNNTYITGPITADCTVKAAFSLIPDTSPDAFTFADQTGVTMNTVVTSHAITVTGINTGAPISITGGEYSVNGGAYTTADGVVNDRDTIEVRVTSSGSSLTTMNATLTIGGVSDTFSVTTRLGYQFIGFLSPVANDGSSIFKAGRTVPIKFQLMDGGGAFVANAAARLRVFKVSDDILGTMNVDSSGDANSDTAFRYDAETNQYIYNLGSGGLGAGTFVLRVGLDDGSVHDVHISLRL